MTSSNDMHVDVLIVGGGLAGCSLGYLLQKAGMSVLIAELRDAKTKDKLCAGVVSTVAMSTFVSIFGDDVWSELGALHLDTMDSVCFEKVLSNAFSCYALPRKRLDDTCLRCFLSAGGTLRDRVSLCEIDKLRHIATFVDPCSSERFVVSYNAIVGADGAASKVRRLLTGRCGRAVAAVEGKVERRGDAIVYSMNPGLVGYCWYIPNIPDATVGAVFHGLTARQCREELRKFCECEGYQPSQLRHALIPTGDDLLFCAGEDVWLIGDAAGLADQMNSGGIEQALDSALALADALQGGPSYEEHMQSRYGTGVHTEDELFDRVLSGCLGIALKGSAR